MAKVVNVKYDANTLKIQISINNQMFDVTRIQHRPIQDWLYPLIVKKVRWDGLYEELKAFTGLDEFSILFDSDDQSLAVLQNAMLSYPVKVSGTNNRVVILYNTNPILTKITVNGKVFDTTRIANRPIDEWVYPMQFGDIKWDGIYAELNTYFGVDYYHLQFVGDQSLTKELMDECPAHIDITVRPAMQQVSMSPSISTTQAQSVSQATVAAHTSFVGNAQDMVSNLHDKIGDISQNEGVRKTMSTAKNVGNKIGESILGAVSSMKSSEQYGKIMESSAVQTVSNNSFVKKISAIWKGLDKRIRIGALIVLVIFVVVLLVCLFLGTKKYKTDLDDASNALGTPHEINCGSYGISSYQSLGVTATFYFSAGDPSTVYRVDSEDGATAECTSLYSEIDDRTTGLSNYDISVIGLDTDEDNDIEFTIYSYDGSDQIEECIVIYEYEVEEKS